MTRQQLSGFFAGMILAVLMVGIGQAQDVALTGGSAVAVENPQPVTVAFRLVEWKAAHLNDPAEIEPFLTTLKQLGCEVAQENHGGHQDIRFRSAAWRPLTVESEALAHQWHGWLTNHGFETVHSHATVEGKVVCEDDCCKNAAGEVATAVPAGGQAVTGHEGHDHAQHAGQDHAGHVHAGHNHAAQAASGAPPAAKARVVFHLPAEQTRHFENPNEAAEFTTLVTALGCQIQQGGHEGHQDLVIRCPDKRWLEFSDHAAAHAWIEWLTSQGFATEHAD